MQDRSFGFATRAIHAGSPPDPTTGSRALPIYQTAAFVFGTTEQAAELFQLRSYGHIYSRISNPTVSAFEERMASLEGGLGGDRVFERSCRAALHGARARASRRSHRQLAKHLRRHGDAVQHHDPPHGHRDQLRAGRRLRRDRGSDPPEHQTALCRDDRQPVGHACRPYGAREARAQARHPAGGRQHVRLAVPVPPDRARRRHRGAFGDQVHQRPRHDDGWNHGRIRALRFCQRQVSTALASPAPAITTRFSPKPSASTRSSCGRAPKCCATSARRCRRWMRGS